MRADTHGKRGFTLIELLVVVAIIALLIAILLPSLSKARKQARTSLCASRIAQLAKSLFLYAEDYEETPPFMGTGYENIKDVTPGSSKQYFGQSVYYWALNESWIIPRVPDCWRKAQDQWPADSRVNNGLLFGYARFADLYRCPEFERLGAARKSQNVFNYTRGITARKCLSKGFPEDNVSEALMPGPILKPSNVYSPSLMWMLFDEQWDFHCAIPIEDMYPSGHAGPGLPAQFLYNFWMGIEPIQSIAGDMLGSYHATSAKPGALAAYKAIRAGEMGSLASYDGHVELFRDPLVHRAADPAATMPEILEAALPAALEMADLMIQQIFAQRGKSLLPEDLIPLFSP